MLQAGEPQAAWVLQQAKAKKRQLKQSRIHLNIGERESGGSEGAPQREEIRRRGDKRKRRNDREEEARRMERRKDEEIRGCKSCRDVQQRG